MLELAEALEKYTVIQLLAAMPLMFVIWLIIREIKGVVQNEKPSKPVEDATQLALATAIGSMSDMLGPKMEAFGDVLKVISSQLVQQTTILQTNDTASAKQTTIIDQTSKAVNIMNDTVTEQSGDIKKILAAIERLEKKFDKLGVEFRDTRQELDSIKTDVEKMTKPKLKPAPPGVPVTPKPQAENVTSETGKVKSDG